MNNTIWTIAKLLNWTVEHYQKHQIESPRIEAEHLLAFTLGLKRIELYINFEKTVTPEQLALFKGYLQRRLKHEPLAYITNNQPFMSLNFYVDKNVLIPRPETELLVENTIDLMRNSPHLNVGNYKATILDLGTGSGCIAISLAKFLPNVTVVGIDSSPAAIEVAKKNATKHGVADRCQFIIGDMFAQLKEKVDIIVSNPPYIPTAEIETLQPEVKDWEPRGALDGGLDGLDYIRKLMIQAPDYCTTALLFEFGFNQAPMISKLDQSHYEKVTFGHDLNGLDRIWQANLRKLAAEISGA